MSSFSDIRDPLHLSGNQVLDLNFINSSGPYVFRKFYRSGLRSFIFEVLPAREVFKETQGEWIDGIKMFPRARPEKMFRILRTRFESKESIFSEIKKYRILLNCLGPDLIAASEEFIADYQIHDKFEMVLCGLQEYVDGEILDPWRLSGKDRFKDIFASMLPGPDITFQVWLGNVKKNTVRFVQKIREMITRAGYIPDLAGIGNLILTRHGRLKLVDINNIARLKLDDIIAIDDKGYPSCDVSIEVLSLLERDLLEIDPPENDPLYRHFLTPERRAKVRMLEKHFYKSL